MKITFEWNYDHISCNTCPFSRLGSIDYAVYCMLTDEQVIATMILIILISEVRSAR